MKKFKDLTREEQGALLIASHVDGKTIQSYCYTEGWRKHKVSGNFSPNVVYRIKPPVRTPFGELSEEEKKDLVYEHHVLGHPVDVYDGERFLGNHSLVKIWSDLLGYVVVK